MRPSHARTLRSIRPVAACLVLLGSLGLAATSGRAAQPGRAPTALPAVYATPTALPAVYATPTALPAVYATPTPSAIKALPPVLLVKPLAIPRDGYPALYARVDVALLRFGPSEKVVFYLRRGFDSKNVIGIIRSDLAYRVAPLTLLGTRVTNSVGSYTGFILIRASARELAGYYTLYAVGLSSRDIAYRALYAK